MSTPFADKIKMQHLLFSELSNMFGQEVPLYDKSLLVNKVCNQTLSLYNVAIGTEKEGTFQTEGWWTLSANECVSPITEDLSSRYVYVFATNIYGDDAFNGEITMCLDRHKHFEITGTDNCWLRGHEAARFKEVDTHSSNSWTIFIQETRD